jgi:hypothetical protein
MGNPLGAMLLGIGGFSRNEIVGPSLNYSGFQGMVM